MLKRKSKLNNEKNELINNSEHTNGLTNNKGLVNGNGLTNGNGLVNGNGIHRKKYMDNKFKELVTLSIIFIILMGSFGAFAMILRNPETSKIQIDGNFNDWNDIYKYNNVNTKGNIYRLINTQRITRMMFWTYIFHF